MKKIFGVLTGVCCWLYTLSAFGTEKFEILPDLPEPLAAAQASSVSTVANDTVSTIGAQSVGHEPNLISVVFSMIFVILLIYLTGIIYTKLNKLGFNTMKKQMGEIDKSKVSVVSTTPLGNNKTLHVVELDGKRMLIGASASSIHLIKDLGNYPPVEFNEGEFSKIEIPNIRIPKIEIPKIEFPNIGFTKAFASSKSEASDEKTEKAEENDDKFEISDIYEESPDGIIDKLFKTETVEEEEKKESEEHKVDPDEYALYRKYL